MGISQVRIRTDIYSQTFRTEKLLHMYGLGDIVRGYI